MQKVNIDKTCRLCGEKMETTSNIVRECRPNKKEKYNTTRLVHWKLCGKYKDRSEKRYKRRPESVIEIKDIFKNCLRSCGTSIYNMTI